MTLTFPGYARLGLYVWLACISLPIYGSLLVFNSNIRLNSAPLRDISLRNLSDIGIDLSSSLRSKCNGINELPVYAFLLMFNSNIWHNSVTLREIMLQNVSDLDFDLSRSLKVKCDNVKRHPRMWFYSSIY